MRLDSYLVEIGTLGSRGRAKRAIIEGHVKVNTNVILKPSYDVGFSDKIELSEGLDKPAGYWKLKEIQANVNLIKAGDLVLDIGSSAGGFLLFASGIAGHAHGIEFSTEFRSELTKIAQESNNITIEFGDVFTMLFEAEKYDCLLVDITVDPLASLKALANVLTSLKHGGMLLQVVKLKKKTDIEPVRAKIFLLGIEIIEILESGKKEAYIIARKL